MRSDTETEQEKCPKESDTELKKRGDYCTALWSCFNNQVEMANKCNDDSDVPQG
jgi:hypothetical protein